MDMSLEEKLVILLGKSPNHGRYGIQFSLSHFVLSLITDNATNPNNSELDVAKIDAFCCAVKNGSALAAAHATKLLADRIQSDNPGESLNALNVSLSILWSPQVPLIVISLNFPSSYWTSA